MSFRAYLLTFCAIAFLGSGCANTPRLRRDVFATSNQRSRLPADSGGARDPVRDVSTSPATDPFYGDIGMKDPAPRQAVFEDPEYVREQAIPPADRSAEAAPATGSSDPTVQFAGENQGVAESPRADYESVRKRLDAANAQNWRTERDDSADKFLFYCEVPIPGKPDIARAFEARDENELRAMLAVTEAIEEWIRDGQKDD